MRCERTVKSLIFIPCRFTSFINFLGEKNRDIKTNCILKYSSTTEDIAV